jgi:hypothetical protein
MWRLAGMQRGSMMAKAARAAKPAALKASSIVPKLAHHSLPSFAVRAGALTVLSTFSAMATHSYNMNIFDEEVDMDFLEGNDDESVASAAEEPAVSAAAEREAEASEESEAEASEECAVSAGASEERAVSAAASEEREDGSQDGSQRGSQDGSWDGSQADGAFDDDDDFDDGVDDDFPEPSPEHVRTATLQVGKEAEHDLLGVGTVLARGTEEDNAGKILFKFVKKVKQGRSWVPQTVERWVFEDALTAVMNNDGEGNVSAEAGPSGTSAFDEMQEHARATNAFTQGMSAPELAAHERKRKAKTARAAASARGPNTAVRKTKEPKVDPSLRVVEFPNNSLIVDNGELFCVACTKKLSLRKVTINSHCNQSKTHEKNMAKYVETLNDDDKIRILISKHFEEKPDERGHTIAPDVHVYRWRVCETLMYAGVPMAKIDMLRKLLEREGHALSDSSDMSATYIPRIEDREIKRVVKELFEQYFSVIFDGTTRLGEAINIVTRSITDDFTIRMRLVAFKTTKVHCDGNALFRLILTTLQTKLGLDLDYCVAYARDSCATNHVAVNLLMPASTNALNMLCFPHTLHNTGKHLELPVLNEFMTSWLNLVPQPGAAKLRWEAILGKGCSKYSKVRWWSRWEIMQEIATNFGALPNFLADLDNNNIGDATTKKMIEILTNQKDALELELAAVMSCERLCTATYRLEGDGLELLLTHRTIEALRMFGRTIGTDASNLPNVAALLRNRHVIAKGTDIREWFPAPHNAWFTGKVTMVPTRASPDYQIKYADGTTMTQNEQEVRNVIDVTKFADWQKAVDMVKGAYDYLENRITDNCQGPYHCSGPYEVCRVSQLFDPSFVAANLTAAAVDELCAAIPSMTDKAQLKSEVEAYKTAAAAAPAMDHSDVHAFTEAVLEFWRKHGKKMPTWRKMAKRVFAIPPNSAASERVFSLLEAMFGKDQDASLSDMIQGALMLRYNKRAVG